MRFDYTREGCAAAKEWLIQTNNLHKLEREQSMDGWTLVSLANTLKEKIHE